LGCGVVRPCPVTVGVGEEGALDTGEGAGGRRLGDGAVAAEENQASGGGEPPPLVGGRALMRLEVDYQSMSMSQLTSTSPLSAAPFGTRTAPR
jgi:hypothetical protein